jgi:Putative lumazine-binding
VERPQRRTYDVRGTLANTPAADKHSCWNPHRIRFTSLVALSEDRAAVEAVTKDYFEGWFTGDTERMDRALHPALVKRAGERRSSAEFPFTTKEQMMEFTAAGEGASAVGDGRLDVSVADVFENIANVTVRGGVYREYLQLVRTEEGWKIIAALWEYDR